METEPIPPNVPKRQRHRSPSYPAFDLETTFGRAQQLYDLAGSHGVPVPTALETWGFSAKSSNGSLTIAALKRFDLANDEGKRGARSIVLTRLGQELVVYSSQRDSANWRDGIRRAALSPDIHAALWTKYDGKLPPDSVIRPYLVIELGFSDSAAKELMREFRNTIEFANLTSAEAGATLPKDEHEDASAITNESAEPSMTAPVITSIEPQEHPAAPSGGSPSPSTRERTIQVPYSPGGWALLKAEFPMSQAEWGQMLAVLDAMKPSLVVDD